MYEYASAADSSGGVACPAGVSPARRGHRKETTCGFLLLVNLPLSLRGHGENRRDETAPKRSTAVGLPLRGFLRLFAVHRQRTATQVGGSTQARHNSVAQPFGTV